MEEAHEPDNLDAPKRMLHEELDATDSYASTQGDVMLEILLERPDPERATLVLKQRKKPIYTHSDGNEVDIAAYSGLNVLEREEIAELPLTKGKARFGLSDAINFDDGTVVNRDTLAKAIQLLFTRIREYECHQIVYERAYDGHGIDRKAQVSVTGIDLLRQFRTPETAALPKTYHTNDNGCKTPTIPTFSNGCTVYILPVKYWRTGNEAENTAEPNKGISGPTLISEQSAQ